MRRVLLAVDLSYQCYRAAAAHPELQAFATGEFTGGLYGFLASFGKAVRETGATDCVVCLDSPPYARSREYPEYKQIRKGTADPELRQRKEVTQAQVLELLRVAGVPTWAAPGFECDDLIASAVTRHRSRWSMIYAQTNDSDLYQLLGCRNFAVFRDDMKTLVTYETLLHKTGVRVTPAEYMLCTALTGTHNDIAGIAGVGPVKALQAVLEAPIMRRLRAQHAELIDRNVRLIRLPHRDLPPMGIPTAGRTAFDERALYRWLARYDIECTLPMVNAFAQLRRST